MQTRPPIPAQARHIEALLAQVRLLLGGRGAGGHEGALGLLAQAEGFCEELEPDSNDARRQGAAIAFHAAALLEATQERRLMVRCLELLAGRGAVGFVLAASGLARTGAAGETFRLAVGDLAANERLALANRRLACVRDEDPAQRQWALDQAHTLQGEDPEEALLFLEYLAARGEELACVVQNGFLRGRFGVWLHQLLKLDLDAAQASYMAATVGCLGSRDLALLLSKHLTTLHRAGGRGPAHALDVLGRAGGGDEGRLHEIVLRFLGHPDTATALAAARALVRLGASDGPAALARAFARRVALRPALAGLAARLSWRGFAHFLRALQGEEGEEAGGAPLADGAVLRLAAAVAAAFPEDAASLAGRIGGRAPGRGGPSGPDGAPLAAALAALGKAVAVPARGPAFKASPPVREAAAAGDGDEGAGMLDRVRGLFGGGRSEEAGPCALTGLLRAAAGGRGATLEGKTLRDESLAEAAGAPGAGAGGGSAVLAGVRFVRCTLANVDFSECDLSGVAFVECRLNGVDFSACRAQDVTFTDCGLNNCRLSGSSLRGLRLARCQLAFTHLAASVTVSLALAECTARRCNLWGARLAGARAEGCVFEECEFSCADFTDAALDGCRFTDCLFSGVHAGGARFGTCVTRACAFDGATLRGLGATDPHLLGARDARLLLDVEQAAAATDAALRAVPAPLRDARGRVFLRAFLELWFFEKDACAQRTAFLRQNRRRLDWCRAKMGGARGAFLDALPGLVQAPAVRPAKDGGKGFVPAPAARIRGWTPDLEARRALRRLLEGAGEGVCEAAARPGGGRKGGKGGKEGTDAAAPSAVLMLEGLYSIGSVGSIAQTRASDLDLWVCYDGAAVDGQALAAFKAKLAAIEAWAEREAGLEVHFFLMELADIRTNNFGFSDAESAGTTQAKLLKEEFYRTALLLAGREPAWWLTPPGADDASYGRALARMEAGRRDRSPLLPVAAPLDMGALGAMPREEFFGASLWQIVKALKSPFKSVMKFALLDKYYSGGDVPMLLCDRIKENLAAGRDGLWDADPYAVLFREVYEYYRGSQYADAQALMRRAFILKTGCTLPGSAARAAMERGSSLMEFFYPHSEEPIAREFMPADAGGGGEDADGVLARFSDLISLGDMVGQFMFRAYEHVQAGLRRADMDVMVSAEDLTKVGRKMFSCLKPRPNKIMRISFVDSPKDMFPTLQIACDGLKGGPVTWIVQGETQGAPGRRKVELEPVRGDGSVQRLAIWLVANGVFSAGTHLTGQNLKPPVSVPDVKELLLALLDFFPPKKVFDTDIAENLRTEEVVKAFVLTNFLAPREVRKYEDVTLIHATNWGELFCRTRTVAHELLPRDPFGFVRANAEIPLRKGLRITGYAPRRAICPRLELPPE
ncbi:MAG: class I adenylate cyclase [Desulfovibrionaceae bacterium]|nr:class I adenylate cyclase [Desulfovibrionaceae bacterium]